MTFTIVKQKWFFSQKDCQQTVEAQNMCIRYVKKTKPKQPKTKHQEKKKIKKTNVTEESKICPEQLKMLTLASSRKLCTKPLTWELFEWE